MGLDQLLELLSAVSYKLLPILGVVVLIFLIGLLRNLYKLAKESIATIKAMKEATEVTTKQLTLLEKPLGTLNSLSDTVDHVHEASKHAARSLFVALIENFSVMKDWAFSMKNKEEQEVVNTNRSDDDESKE
ncbi:MAG: histidine kinase [Erysipelotrichaceae bacterium]|nr:histidine kinase [Erysipelotrichaceae bacterium]